MKILYRYIGKSVLITFIATLMVMIGILCLGNLLRIADLIVKGMDPIMIFKFLYFLIMSLLQEAIPMAFLTAILLVFGRFSSDNEITAMRACGIGLRTITAPVFLIGIGLTVLCTHLNNTVIPNNCFATRQLKEQIGLRDPELMLEPGEFVKLPGYSISIQSKKDGFLQNIMIYQYQEGKLSSTIVARRAKLESFPRQEGFTLHLYDGSIDEYDKDNPQVSTRTVFGYLKQPIDLKKLYDEQEKLTKRSKDMTYRELIQYRNKLWEDYSTAAAHLRDLVGGAEGGLKSSHPTFRELARLKESTLGTDRETNRKNTLIGRLESVRALVSQVSTEIHKRLSLSVACFAFVLIGIPLAIKTHRSEKSIGMAMSLILIFVFYIFIMYAKAVSEVPERYPHLIIWIPNLIYCGVGTFWMIKFTRI